MSEPKPPPGGAERFAHLERGRTTPLRESVQPGAAERFGAVQQGGAPVQATSGVSPGRFEAPEVAEVAVVSNREEEQPFVVCAACGLESGKFEARCPGCGASFDTDVQREHNARVWRARRAAQVEEQARAVAKEQALLEAAREDARHRHELGVAIAREVKQAHASSSGGDGVLFSLLGRLPSPWGWVTGAALVLVPMAVAACARRHSLLERVALGVFVLVMVLFLPRGWWTRRVTRWPTDGGWGV